MTKEQFNKLPNPWWIRVFAYIQILAWVGIIAAIFIWVWCDSELGKKLLITGVLVAFLCGGIYAWFDKIKNETFDDYLANEDLIDKYRDDPANMMKAITDRDKVKKSFQELLDEKLNKNH